MTPNRVKRILEICFVSLRYHTCNCGCCDDDDDDDLRREKRRYGGHGEKDIKAVLKHLGSTAPEKVKVRK